MLWPSETLWARDSSTDYPELYCSYAALISREQEHDEDQGLSLGDPGMDFDFTQPEA